MRARRPSRALSAVGRRGDGRRGPGEVWAAALDWLQGGRSNVRSAVVDLEVAAETLGSSGSERERATAATQLGMACRDPSSAAPAAAALLASLGSATECVQRSAAYGLSVGGPAVVAPLLERIVVLLDRDRTWLRTTPHKVMTMDSGTGADYTWHQLTNAVFALGESLETATPELLAVLERVLSQAAEGIEEYLEGMSPEELAAAEEGGRTRGFYLCTHQARPSAAAPSS